MSRVSVQLRSGLLALFAAWSLFLFCRPLHLCVCNDFGQVDGTYVQGSKREQFVTRLFTVEVRSTRCYDEC